MENYENKLNKIGLLQNPIGIGTISVEPPCRLIQVTLGIYRVLYMIFWPAEFSGYHQCQQESQ